jgi:ribosomal protein S18 acetylase RimI-like enzyme
VQNTIDIAAAITPPPQPVVLRDATTFDLPDILVIERQSFSFPWAPGDFRRSGPCVVLEVGGEVIGFAVYDCVRKQKAGRPPEIEILNLAISKPWRGQGAATALVRWMKKQIEHGHYRTLSAVVSERNDAAIRFFLAIGFRATGLVPQPWPDDTQDDGIRFVYCRQTPREFTGAVDKVIDRAPKELPCGK